MNLNDTLTLLEKLLALSVTVQTFEFLALRSAWSESGLWRWSILKEEYPRGLRGLLGIFLSERGFGRLLHVRLILCAFILIFPASTQLNGILLLLLFFSVYLSSIRWRGAFNGGSDSMTLINLLLLSLSGLASTTEFSQICLIVMAVNLSLSFVLSGLSKLFVREWRNGSALPRLLRDSNYRNPGASAGRLASPPFAMTACWAVVAFELAFPLAFTRPLFAISFTVVAMIFHFVNWRLFGLNRFFFAWGATYPVVFYFAN